ncbi:alginate lyase family protein [Bacteroides ovatus]|uniref:alginate lyase family protein n=1 Tax=Bacteroides ovatus TaxID=28116 RepID=UPI003144F0E3
MKKIYYVAIALAYVMTSCGDGLNLPSIEAETDLNKIPVPENLEKLMEIPLKPETEPMLHNGALHTEEDFQRVKENLNNEPWKSGYEVLIANNHSQLTWRANPQTSIVRGSGHPENYPIAYNDAAAAYQLGLRYRLGEGETYAEKAIEIMTGWANTCTLITGSTDQALASGLYGYEFAVAGEQIRDYWMENDPEGFASYQNWMVNLFYKANHDFLVNHFGTPSLHYWANWGLCNIASVLAIGILADRRDIYNEGIEHLQIGETSGRMTHAIYHVFGGEYSNLAQWQESGRDAGHTFLCQGLMGTICQLTFNQGDDFFAYNDNMFLKACEYNGRYHVAGLEVPYAPYIREFKGPHGTAYEEYNVIAPRAGGEGPIWALPYYHYTKVKNIDADKCQYAFMGMNKSFPEGGGGNYGPNSGGYDHLGFGTLMYAR